MRRVFLLVLAALAASDASARDADSLVFGAQIDALAEYADELAEAGDETDDEDASAADDALRGGLDAPTEGGGQRRGDLIAEQRASDPADGEAASGTGSEFTLRHGYDSNYDESSDPEGSSFTEAVATATWAKEGDGGGFYVGIGATALRLHDLDWKNRGDGYVDLGFRKEIRDGIAVHAALGLSVDGTTDPVEGAARATLGVEGAGSAAVWGVRAAFSAERGLTEIDADEDVPLRTYDFVRPEIEASLLLRPDARVSPYLLASVSRTTFPLGLPEGLTDDDDVEIAAPNRDATEYVVSAGLRLKPADDFTLRLGLRGNLRDFDQSGVRRLATLGPELAAEWEISPQLTVSAEASRTIGEPEDLGALAEDITSLGTSMTYTPIEKLELSGSASFDRTRIYGIRSVGDEISLELAAIYRATSRTALELRLDRLWYLDRFVEDDDYTQTRISAGGTVTF